MDDRRFVEALMAAVPEAFDRPSAREHYLDDEPLPYAALGDARCWLDDHAIKVPWFGRRALGRRARVRRGREDVVRRFWDFVEQRAQAGAGDVELENLLFFQCFEGVSWLEDLIEYLGPRTRELVMGTPGDPTARLSAGG